MKTKLEISKKRKMLLKELKINDAETKHCCHMASNMELVRMGQKSLLLKGQILACNWFLGITELI
jgi:hypothetical protein